MRKLRWLILAMPLVVGVAGANEPEQVTAAGFSSLRPGSELPSQWQPLTVKSIPRHTRYTLTSVNDVTVLRAEADASMSSVAREMSIDPQTTPWLRWQWRIAELNKDSALGTKDGDDFPARLYVFFDYDIMQLPFVERVVIRIARALHGQGLPLAALCYVWAKDEPPGSTAWSAYTDRVRMVVASSGADQVGQWVTVERNIIDDYRDAFGEPVPRITGIALATDSDNSGTRSLAWYGDITFASQPKQR